MENVRYSLNGYRLNCEFVKVPIPFVNALRRILLAEIPTVVVRDVVIKENTSQMIHEMLKHRLEMKQSMLSVDLEWRRRVRRRFVSAPS